MPMRGGMRDKKSCSGRRLHSDGSNTESKSCRANDRIRGTMLSCRSWIISFER